MRKRSEVVQQRAATKPAAASDPGITPPATTRNMDLFPGLTKQVPEMAAADAKAFTSEPGTLPYWYIGQYGPTMTRCAACSANQTMTPSGVTCPNGHGGADGIDDNGKRRIVTKAGLLVKQEAEAEQAAKAKLEAAQAEYRDRIDRAAKAEQEVLQDAAGQYLSPQLPPARVDNAPEPRVVVEHPSNAAGGEANPFFMGRVEPGRPMVTATWGKELYSPIQFNNFEVGPFTVVREVAAGEDHAEAFDKAYADARAMAERHFKQKATDYLRRLEELGKIVRARGGQ